jgi:hypothetical protein
MALADGLQIYGAAITTLGILFVSIKYLISFRITPIEGELKNLHEDNKRLETENKEYSEELNEVKQALVDEVKDISKGNYDILPKRTLKKNLKRSKNRSTTIVVYTMKLKQLENQLNLLTGKTKNENNGT